MQLLLFRFIFSFSKISCGAPVGAVTFNLIILGWGRIVELNLEAIIMRHGRH
jgi:hypothetical protein